MIAIVALLILSFLTVNKQTCFLRFHLFQLHNNSIMSSKLMTSLFDGSLTVHAKLLKIISFKRSVKGCHQKNTDSERFMKSVRFRLASL